MNLICGHELMFHCEQRRLEFGHVQTDSTFLLGTLFPEVSLHLERMLFSIELALREYNIPLVLRYPVLNFVAWTTGPLWFSLFILALMLLLLILSVVSLGILVPFTVPLAGLLLGYSMLVPVWLFSVYFFSAWPMLAACFVVMSSEAHAEWSALRAHLRARRMIRAPHLPAARTGRSPKPQAGAAAACDDPAAGRSGSPRSQRNPAAGAAWLSKQELLAMYQRRGLLDSPPPPEEPSIQQPPAAAAAPPRPPPGPP